MVGRHFTGAALVLLAALSWPSAPVQAAVVVVTALGVLSIAASLRITPETAVVDHTEPLPGDPKDRT